jgi:hypothetical protein
MTSAHFHFHSLIYVPARRLTSVADACLREQAPPIYIGARRDALSCDAMRWCEVVDALEHAQRKIAPSTQWNPRVKLFRE